VRKSWESGFTLVELLLSMAMIGIVAGASLPVYFSFYNRNDVSLTTETIASMFRRAQNYARSVQGDSQWGVHIQAGSATLFKGATYAARDTAYDETAVINTSITPTGTTDVLFAKLSGAPGSTASVTLTGQANETRTIIVNAKGTVSY